MILELEPYQVIGFLLTIAGSIFGAGKAFFARFDQALRERDDTLDASIRAISKQVTDDAVEMRQIHKEFLQFKAELPANYVSKADYNRSFTVIDAKLDRLYELRNKHNH